MRDLGSWSAAACAVLLAACASQTPAPAPQTPAKPAPAPSATPDTPAPADASTVPATAPAPSVPASAEQQQSAQRLALAAVPMLEAGEEDKATAQLQRALATDPANKLAQSLMRQIQSDPVATLGREHFTYRVQPGESLSKIAERYLGDAHLFYILARYNELRVPRQLNAGQMVKVPGKAPPPAPAPAPVAQPPSPAPAPAPAVAAPSPPPPAPAAPQADPAKAEKERAAKIATATRAARSAFARQDLVTAIRNWDVVLELDPENGVAKAERQRAVDLKAKLDKLK